MFLRVLICMSLAGSCAFAQSDALQIDGPHEVQPGMLVRLSANTTKNETPFWIVLDPIDLDYEQVDGGKRLLFSSGDQSTSITVILLAQQVVKNRITTRQIRRTIQVSDDLPEDVDAPPPPVTEPPTEPPTQTPTPAEPVLESPVFSEISQAWSNIGTDAAKKLSEAVAVNFDAAAKKCESNQYENIAAIWKELSAKNRQALQIESVAWEPVAVALQQAFQKLKLPDVSSHAFHLRAAAAAIRHAFNQQTTQQRLSQ